MKLATLLDALVRSHRDGLSCSAVLISTYLIFPTQVLINGLRLFPGEEASFTPHASRVASLRKLLRTAWQPRPRVATHDASCMKQAEGNSSQDTRQYVMSTTTPPCEYSHTAPLTEPETQNRHVLR